MWFRAGWSRGVRVVAESRAALRFVGVPSIVVQLLHIGLARRCFKAQTRDLNHAWIFVMLLSIYCLLVHLTQSEVCCDGLAMYQCSWGALRERDVGLTSASVHSMVRRQRFTQNTRGTQKGSQLVTNGARRVSMPVSYKYT